MILTKWMSGDLADRARDWAIDQPDASL